MIRAHLATFPPRAPILMQTVASILPQVDLLCICLNDYSEVPAALAGQARIEVMIPDTDLKDAGKFAFPPAPGDVVFTIDDDILYPPDYVSRMLLAFEQLDPHRDILGYQGNAWLGREGGGRRWRNFLFHQRLGQLLKVDVLGTGTACQLGRNLPALEQMRSAAGFTDLRHARLHHEAGRRMWVLPRGADYLRGNLPDDLRPTSLFRNVMRRADPQMLREKALLMRGLTPGSGLRPGQVRRLEGTARK